MRVNSIASLVKVGSRNGLERRNIEGEKPLAETEQGDALEALSTLEQALLYDVTTLETECFNDFTGLEARCNSDLTNLEPRFRDD